MEKTAIVTRFAPSPTGVLHVGSARTALFNFLYAKKHGGSCILRIEDTDTARSKQEYEEDIKEGLAWLGMVFDTTYRQSERGAVYAEHITRLIDSGHAYISKETPTEEGQRAEVIRFKNPNKKLSFDDTVRGVIEFDTTELGDFVIAKSSTEPLYHLAVVVDDFVMGITHIIRGDDGISNTPRQILIQEALGAPRPIYTHLPLILGADRSKLSKRHGAVSLLQYRTDGYLPDAVNNFLALMGWNPGDEREVFNTNELIEKFSLDRIQTAGAIFNEEKLKWLNKEHLKLMPQDKVYAEIESILKINTSLCKRVAPTILERISNWGELRTLVQEGEFDYLIKQPEYPKEKLFWKDEQDAAKIRQHLEYVMGILTAAGDNLFEAETLKGMLWDYATEMGRGGVLWPMRYALSGKEKSPDPFTLSAMLGKEETLSRLKIAIDKLG